MEDIPKIPFIRKKLAHLNDEQIEEEERRFYHLCEIAKEVYSQTKLTDKSDKLQ